MAKGRIKINKKGQRAIKTALLFFLLVIIVIWIGGLVENYLLRLSLRLEVSREGSVQSVDKLEAVVLQAETLVAIPTRGWMTLQVEEGQRVAAGAVLAQIQSMDGRAKFELKSPAAGIVCFHTDGLETVFTPEKLDELEWEKLKRLSPEATPQEFPEGGKLVYAGDTLLKVVDNLKPVLLAVNWSEDLPRPEIGKNIKLWIEAMELNGKWERAADKMAVIKLERGFDTLPASHKRRLQAEVQYQNIHGIIIPSAALVANSVEQGVYIWDKEVGRTRFNPVEVLGQRGDELVVRGLDAGILVAVNSEKAKELIK